MWKVREIYWRILWMWKRREYSLVQYHLSRRLVGTQKGYLCRCSVHVGVKSNPQLLQRLQKCDNKIRFQAVVNVFKFDKFKSTLRRSSREVFLTSVVKNSFLKKSLESVCRPVLWRASNSMIWLFHKAEMKSTFSFQPRSQGSLLPALRSEREREILENAGHVSPRIWDITNDLGEGQVSVRFVCTERRQVNAALKLCTWPDLERRK